MNVSTYHMKHLSIFLIAVILTSAAHGQMAGAYSRAAVTDPAVAAAVKFAVDAKAREKKIDMDLDDIASAERQVVAGTNYRMCINVTVPPTDYGDEGKRSFRVVVYQDPKNVLKVTSWDEVDSCGAKPATAAASPTTAAANGAFKKLADDFDYFDKIDTSKGNPADKAAASKAMGGIINSISDELALAEADNDINAGKNDEALAILNKYIAANPRSGNALALRANAYIGLQRLDLANADAKKALAVDRTSAKAYFVTGILEAGRGENYPAITSFTRAIELDPKVQLAYYDRGTCYAKISNWQAAVTDLTKAIELAPRDSSAYLNRAIAYGGLHDLDAKTEDLQTANEINPSDPSAGNMLIESLRAASIPDFDALAKTRFARLNSAAARLGPEEVKLSAVVAARDAVGVCRELDVLKPLRSDRTNALSRAIILKIRTDVPSMPAAVKQLDTATAAIESDEKALKTVAANFKCQ
jgi:tetratricopeptide (TPR) repeat protein